MKKGFANVNIKTNLWKKICPFKKNLTKVFPETITNESESVMGKESHALDYPKNR